MISTAAAVFNLLTETTFDVKNPENLELKILYIVHFKKWTDTGDGWNTGARYYNILSYSLRARFSMRYSVDFENNDKSLQTILSRGRFIQVIVKQHKLRTSNNFYIILSLKLLFLIGTIFK